MELEEAKMLLKEMQENCKKGVMKGAIYTDEKAEQKLIAIETVLQALDNSIPKEKVEKKIKEYQHERDKLADGHFWEDANNINQDRILFVASETLKLLLKE